MNRRLNKTQRNYIIIGLCAILVIMGVGYAAFQSQLKISGTSNITSNFLVKITDIEVSSQSGGAADKSDVTTHTDTTATFGTTLQSPGDTITYDITIENQGSIDAVLKTVTKTDTNNSAIIFETSGVVEGEELPHGETATMQVKVTYNPSVTSQPANLESTLNVTLDYEQTDSTVVPSDTTPPVINNINITSSGYDSSQISVGAKMNIEVDASDEESSIEKYEYILSINPIETENRDYADYGLNNVYTYIPTATGTLYVYVRVTNSAGLSSEASEIVSVVAVTPPIS